MLPLLNAVVRMYAPYVVLPFAGIIGFVGYHFESIFRTPAPNRPSVEALRDERLLKELAQGEALAPLSQKAFVPDNIFGKNTSPGLHKPDNSEIRDGR